MPRRRRADVKRLARERDRLRWLWEQSLLEVRDLERELRDERRLSDHLRGRVAELSERLSEERARRGR